MTKKELLQKAGYRPKIGRPLVGTVDLSPLRVPAEIRDGLEKKAFETGITVPNVRRNAYKTYLNITGGTL